MKLWSYSVPCTQPIVAFIADCKKAEGSLTGGFQSTVNELLSRVRDSRIYLDDALVGRCYRYSRCAAVPGSWQDRYFPAFLAEVESLYKTKQHRRERAFTQGLFDDDFGDE